jgi:hypothetical protein
LTYKDREGVKAAMNSHQSTEVDSSSRGQRIKDLENLFSEISLTAKQHLDSVRSGINVLTARRAAKQASATGLPKTSAVASGLNGRNTVATARKPSVKKADPNADFHAAVARGDLDKVKKMLSQKSLILDQKTKKTAFDLALKNQHLEVAQEILGKMPLSSEKRSLTKSLEKALEEEKLFKQQLKVINDISKDLAEGKVKNIANLFEKDDFKYLLHDLVQNYHHQEIFNIIEQFAAMGFDLDSQNQNGQNILGIIDGLLGKTTVKAKKEHLLKVAEHVDKQIKKQTKIPQKLATQVQLVGFLQEAAEHYVANLSDPENPNSKKELKTIHDVNHCLRTVHVANLLCQNYQEFGLLPQDPARANFIALLAAFHDASRVHERLDKNEFPNGQIFYDFALKNGFSEQDAILGGLLISAKGLADEKGDLDQEIEKIVRTFLSGSAGHGNNITITRKVVSDEDLEAEVKRFVGLVKDRMVDIKVVNLADTIEVMRVRLARGEDIVAYRRGVVGSLAYLESQCKEGDKQKKFNRLASESYEKSDTGEFDLRFVTPKLLSNLPADFVAKLGEKGKRGLEDNLQKIIAIHKAAIVDNEEFRANGGYFKEHRIWELRADIFKLFLDVAEVKYGEVEFKDAKEVDDFVVQVNQESGLPEGFGDAFKVAVKELKEQIQARDAEQKTRQGYLCQTMSLNEDGSFDKDKLGAKVSDLYYSMECEAAIQRAENVLERNKVIQENSDSFVVVDPAVLLHDIIKYAGLALEKTDRIIGFVEKYAQDGFDINFENSSGKTTIDVCKERVKNCVDSNDSQSESLRKIIDSLDKLEKKGKKSSAESEANPNTTTRLSSIPEHYAVLGSNKSNGGSSRE